MKESLWSYFNPYFNLNWIATKKVARAKAGILFCYNAIPRISTALEALKSTYQDIYYPCKVVKHDSFINYDRKDKWMEAFLLRGMQVPYTCMKGCFSGEVIFPYSWDSVILVIIMGV